MGKRLTDQCNSLLRIFCILFFAALLFSACIPKKTLNTTITVTAAASLTEPFTEIGDLFQKQHPDVTVLFNFTGSQQGAQQIINGASVDIFASASLTNMEQVVSIGLIDPNQVNLFARNKLAIITPKNNPAGIHNLQDLARPGIKLVLAAPEVPLGNYTQRLLNQTQLLNEFSPEFAEKVTRNVVSLENNARSVVTKVGLGEADAGIAYLSDIYGKLETDLAVIQIPDLINVQTSYYIASLKESARLELADEFVAFVRSASGLAVLESYGFVSPVK